MASRVFWRSWVEAVLGGSTCQLALAVPRPRCGRPRPTGIGTSFFDLDALIADHFFLGELVPLLPSGVAGGHRPWRQGHGGLLAMGQV